MNHNIDKLPNTNPFVDKGVDDACGGLRDEESPVFISESTTFSGGGSVVAFPKVDVLFDAWVADGAVDGVIDVDCGGCVGPAVILEFVFVGMLVVPCLFAALDSGCWPKEEASARRRFSGCDS